MLVVDDGIFGGGKKLIDDTPVRAQFGTLSIIQLHGKFQLGD